MQPEASATVYVTRDPSRVPVRRSAWRLGRWRQNRRIARGALSAKDFAGAGPVCRVWTSDWHFVGFAVSPPGR